MKKNYKYHFSGVNTFAFLSILLFEVTIAKAGNPIIVKSNALTSVSQAANSSGPTLTAIFPDTSISVKNLPYTMVIPVNIGSASMPIPSLSGLSFILTFDSVYAPDSSISLDYSNSIFGPAGAYTNYPHIIPDSIELGIGRLGAKNFLKNTYGNVVNVKLTIPAGAPPGYFKLNAIITSAIDSNARQISVNSSNDSVHIFTPMSAIALIANNDFGLTVSPNPFTSNLSISYSLPQYQNIEFSLIDITGKQYAILANENQSPGRHLYSIDAEKYNMQAGIYFLRMVAGNQVVTQKIVKIQ